MVQNWVTRIARFGETSGGGIEIGAVVPHPNGYNVKIIDGRYWGERGISNFWSWKRVDADGNAYGETENGYGWDAATLKRKLDEAAAPGSSFAALREHAINLGISLLEAELARMGDHLSAKVVDLTEEDWKFVAKVAANATVYRAGSEVKPGYGMTEWTMDVIAEHPELLRQPLADLFEESYGESIPGTLHTAVVLAVRNALRTGIVEDLAAAWEQKAAPAPSR